MTTDAFQALHAALRAQVDAGFLPGVSTALLRGREVVDRFCCGHADLEAGIPLREDHLFRVFSNTKLVTSCAVLLLVEQGLLGLDDPVERWLPELGQRQVLRPGATRIDDVEPARSPMTIRQLMTHTSGLSYGAFDPGTLMFKAYNEAGVHRPAPSLAQWVRDVVAPLPLASQPGTRWEYSIATDVLGRVVEVVSGLSLGEFFAQRIFAPLGMVDTGFWVPPAEQGRLCVHYGGVDLADPRKPGLVRYDDRPYPGAYLSPPQRESGGGGLVSSLGDMVTLIQALLPGGPTLLRPETLAAMMSKQLAPGQHVWFPNMPANPGRRFGLGSGVLEAVGPYDPAEGAGEVGWGGIAGTLWWIHPRLGTAGVLMTQRYMGFGNPYTFEFRRLAYQALAA